MTPLTHNYIIVTPLTQLHHCDIIDVANTCGDRDGGDSGESGSGESGSGEGGSGGRAS